MKLDWYRKPKFSKSPESFGMWILHNANTDIYMDSPNFGTVVHVEDARARFKALNIRAIQTTQPTTQPPNQPTNQPTNQ